MKLKNSFWIGQTEGETIAIFGSARLVKKLDGKIELIGGTADDHADAQEWCSLFAPEVVFTNAQMASPARTRLPMRTDSPRESHRKILRG